MSSKEQNTPDEQVLDQTETAKGNKRKPSRARPTRVMSVSPS